MNLGADLSADGITLTLSVPLQFRRRGGRKQVVMPDGQGAPFCIGPSIDSTLVKAIARAHRWQAMLESGDYSSIAELAAAERINPSYLARVLRLTLLAPKTVDGILNGQHSPGLTLARLFNRWPVEWDHQRFS
jgi:hypothetical protein